MVQISLLLLGLFVICSWAVPSNDGPQEIYLDTCQISCGVVRNNDAAQACRETFCPNYVNYLFAAYHRAGSKPVLSAGDQQEVVQFCERWLLYLFEQFGWPYHGPLKLQECICTPGKDCFIK